ncbi:MAG: anti-sigma factor family protein, partial [Methyloligellaceae bacterium]
MTEQRKFSERDFHAYIDGELDSETLREVEAWLEAHPEDMTLVENWEIQGEILKQHFDPVLNEPISNQLVAELKNRSAKKQIRQWSM